ncbi:HK97 gp10 family phage protein [Agrobacterium vitis]|uniref:HK97 gp10 family phage protein n=1 Tax=Agrobacterium vitis TaxID=373 RepID=A0AAE5AWE9_AGRVI|nr:HK97-gp10 family putative phage morphogenesis protein [Agrobacterium vitis]MCF1499635.1 HK97 gp10 family phage protein [Allorhizobium sp. Av2]MCM2440703.1 HK97 gp10 family phage protein [Agrobacterium vitis]MUZ59318.1 HK97 gp10 family phage protein [Agrobacterium vitis]MVA66549.1 HK97 gp10 family phage protein [Agrobacterium vitis]MVA87410.1 HK97 gp10 family phage protein [Agrobacterium vitis]
MANDGGISRLQQRMNAIPKAVRDGVRPAMEKAAGDIVDLARALVPEDEGKLKNSIGWTWGTAPAGSMVLAQSVSGELTITIYAGDDEAYYARWVEFGTQAGVFNQRVSERGAGIHQSKSKGRKSYRTHPGTAAQPFFFPAYRLGKKRAANLIKRAIVKSVRENWGKGQ